MIARAIELLALSLAPAEREAVLGDLNESSQSAASALRDLIGLVLRRSLRPIASALVMLPLALLLAVLARGRADGVAVYLWLWTSNLDPHLLASAGFWNGVVESAPRLLLACLTLAFCSWSTAALASRLSRGTSLLFCAMLLLTAPLGPPASLLGLRARDFQVNAAAFHGLFYRDVFPCVLQCLFVLLPALIAIRQPETAP